MVFHAGQVVGAAVFVLSAGRLCAYAEPEKYFLRIYAIAVGMGALQYVFLSFVRRPDGFVPQNQMLATFSILLVILQGIEWCRQRQWLKGLCAVLLPLLWPVLGMGLIYQVPASTPVVLILHYTVLPMHTAIMMAEHILSWKAFFFTD